MCEHGKCLICEGIVGVLGATGHRRWSRITRVADYAITNERTGHAVAVASDLGIGAEMAEALQASRQAEEERRLDYDAYCHRQGRAGLFADDYANF